MRLSWATWIAACVVAAAASAQEPAFAELRRWRWRSPDVVCGAADAAGTLAALGRRDASGGVWEVMVWDAKARAEVRTIAVKKRPVSVRFPDADAFFSLSHWHRFRIADGAPSASRC